MFIPDPDLDYSPIPDPGVKKAPDPDPHYCSSLKVVWAVFDLSSPKALRI
jgi:hypothetical protein